MNTKIAKQINEARKVSSKELSVAGRDIVEVHNDAVDYGFLDLPRLELVDTEMLLPDNGATVVVCPMCGVMKISDLWALKEAWGADDIEVYLSNSEADTDGIAVVFKNR